MDVKIKAFVLTVSDTRDPADDLSGEVLADLVNASGWELVGRGIVTDELDELREMLRSLTQRRELNLILTTGGTGLSPRDNTPEATRAVIEREIPGIAEAMRRETSDKTPMAMLSRGVAGARNGTLIINLPGSPKAVRECFEVVRPVLQHSVDQVSGHTKH